MAVPTMVAGLLLSLVVHMGPSGAGVDNLTMKDITGPYSVSDCMKAAQSNDLAFFTTPMKDGDTLETCLPTLSDVPDDKLLPIPPTVVPDSSAPTN